MNLFDWIISNVIVLFFDYPTIVLFVILLMISVSLAHYWMGYDLKLIIYTLPAVCFLWAGVLFIVWGGVTLGIPSANEPTNITLVNMHFSSIQFVKNSSINSSINSSYDLELIDYKLTNSTYYTTIKPIFETTNLSPVEVARKKLGGGMFSNGIGLIGLGVALFSLGLFYTGSIENKRNQEEIVARLQHREYILKKYRDSLNHQQIYQIGILWLGVGLMYLGIYMWIYNTILIPLIVIGFVLVLIGFYKSRLPSIEPPQCTFDELIQKITDESNLKKE